MTIESGLRDQLGAVLEELQSHTNSLATNTAAIATNNTNIATLQGLTPTANIVQGALVASGAAAGIFSWQNTTTHKCAVAAFVNVTTASSGACSISVGQAATSVLSANLLDTQSVASIALLSSFVNGGSTGKAFQRVNTNEFVTASVASGTVTGLVGKYTLLLVYLD